MGRGKTKKKENDISNLIIYILIYISYFKSIIIYSCQLGVTPINAFDAFNLRPGGEYKFRVTPRNRYGWGESLTTTNSVLVIESTDLPEFTKILSGQLKVLEGTSVKLECEASSSKSINILLYFSTNVPNVLHIIYV